MQYYEEYNRIEQELYEAYPQNVSFKSGLAISYEKLGETHASLGNLDKALQYYEESNRLEKELYEAYPENGSFKNGLAISYSKLGSTHASLGNLDKALQYYEERSRLGKELYEAYPQNVSFKNGLAISYFQLGDFYQNKTKDILKAKEYLHKAKKHFEELATTYPAYPEFKDNLKWVNGILKDL